MTPAQRIDLHRRLSTVGITPCSDGGCIFVHPGGQHTNGGCGHLKGDLTMTKIALQRAAIVLRQYAEERT